jgi:hypothetical protein
VEEMMAGLAGAQPSGSSESSGKPMQEPAERAGDDHTLPPGVGDLYEQK